MPIPDPSEVQPWYLRNINQALALDEPSGNVYLRTYTTGAIETATSKSAFGENLAVTITPVVQLDAIYDLDPTKFETFTYGGGTAQSANSKFEVTAGSTANSYGVIRSKKFIRYRPGQGCIARFTAGFTATDGVGPAGFTQRAGFFNQEQAVQIGYDTNGKFGILRANGGKAQISQYTFTVFNDGSVVLQLNGVTFSSVTVAGGSIAANIAALVAGLLAQPLFAALYTVEYDENDITFLATSLGPQTGTNSITGATATYSSLQSGVAQTEYWTYQEDWNIDTLDGNGPSGAVLDTTKLNVYQINFCWLGAGELRFAIENPLNGDMIFFHHIHYANQHTAPHLDNPSLKIGYVAANLTNPGSGSVSVIGSSMMGGIEGTVKTTTNPQAATGSRNDSMNSPGSVYHLLTIKNRLVYRNKINTRDLIIKTISAGVTATAAAPATLYVYYSPTLPGNRLWQSMGEWNASYYATGQFIITSLPQPIAVYQFASGSALNTDISNLDIHIPPQGYITFAVSCTSNMNAASAGVTFIED